MDKYKNNNSLFGLEIKRINRRIKYVETDRNRGRTIRFDDNCTQDKTRSNIIEDVIIARNMHIALHKALAELSADEYKIISECFFESNKPNLTKLAQKYGITRQAYTNRRDRILIKLKSLVISHYEEF